MFAIGDLELRGGNVIAVGGKEAEIDEFTYKELEILKNDEVKKFEWVKFVDDYALPSDGFFFSGDEDSILIHNPFVNFRKAIKLMRKKEEGAFRKSKLFFEMKGNSIQCGKKKVDGLILFMKIVKIMGLNKENMSAELWEIIKDDIENSVFAIIEKRGIDFLKRAITWRVWFSGTTLIEGSKEKIEQIVNEILADEI